MTPMIQELIKLADYLDGIGLFSYADEVDKVHEQYFKKQQDPRYAPIFQKIKSALNGAGLDASVLAKVLGVVDSVASGYQEPVKEYLIEHGSNYAFVPAEVYELAVALSALIVSKAELGKELSSATEEDRVGLEREWNEVVAKVYDKIKQLDTWKAKDPGAYDAAKRYIEHKVNHVGAEISLYPERRSR